jgi:hypothetical protein
MRPPEEPLEAHLQEGLRQVRDEWRGGSQAGDLEAAQQALAHEVAARVQQIEGRTVRDRFVRGSSGVGASGPSAAAPKLERHLRDRLRDVQDQVLLGQAPDVAAYEAQRAQWRKR